MGLYWRIWWQRYSTKRAALRYTRSKRCYRIRSIPLCWRMFTISSDCQAAPRPSRRLRQPTNYKATDHWWQDGRETGPVYYEVQGRHYMAVMGADRVFFCCLYGNTEDEVIIRTIENDMGYEQEMIYLEQCFWENHVLAKDTPPAVHRLCQGRQRAPQSPLVVIY